MYGFVIDAIRKGCFKDFNKKIWQGIVLNTNAPTDFDHNVDYDVAIFYEIVEGATIKLKYTHSAVMQLFGRWFIHFIHEEWKMDVMGRRPTDFFETWNDFMEYKASEYQNFIYDIFKVVGENDHGFSLEYGSPYANMGRFSLGIIDYIMCDIYKIDRSNLQISSENLTVTHDKNSTPGFYQLEFKKSLFKINFDNQTFATIGKAMVQATLVDGISSKLKSSQILRLFPCYLCFNKSLEVLYAGNRICQSCPDILGANLSDMFALKQPFNGELSYNYFSENLKITYILGPINDQGESTDIEESAKLALRGQMILVKTRELILFLCDPVAACFLNKNNMFYISDTQRNTKQALISRVCLKKNLLEHSLDVELENVKYREKYAATVNKDMEIADALMNQIMPPHISKIVRLGKPYGDTCQTFTDATVLLSDMVGFTTICTTIKPMEVAMLLNSMYMTFDSLVDKKKSLYKAETIGDGYMVVVGIMEREEKHAQQAADMGLAMITGLKDITLPFNNDIKIQVRVGINSGPMVAGVMGWKVPRYGLFGNTVIVANFLESTSLPNMIHLGESTYKLLSQNDEYVMKPRRKYSIPDDLKTSKIMGTVKTTYWLCGKEKYVMLSIGDDQSKDVIECFDMMQNNDDPEHLKPAKIVEVVKANAFDSSRKMAVEFKSKYCSIM